CKPWGLNGGMSGFGNDVALHRFGKSEELHFPNGKALNQVLQAGDAYILRSGGGGGYGSPLERDLAALERDVRCGYVTKAAAEECYGAVFRDATLTIDAAATQKRRAIMREQGLPHDQPIAESMVPIAPAPHHEHNPEHAGLTEEERVAFAMQCRCCS
ncbi:MAG: hydantoinase B/oxoprolinase family protein, partial [Pseudomonadota bacterium]